MLRRMLCLTFAVLVEILVVPTAGAAGTTETYPSKHVRVVVPTAPGGGLDMLARMLAQRLSATLGQQFLIDNRPGAGATIGTGLVARSAPDGYTLLIVPSSFTITSSLYKRLPYDPVKDLAPVMLVASTPSVLVVHPSIPVRSVRDLIKLAKAQPGQLNYASAGVGTHSHLGMEMLKKMARFEATNIPHKGMGPAITDIIAGHASLLITGLPPVFSHIKAGKLRAIAVADAERSRVLPALSTVAESGLPGYAVENWFGLFVPAGTPEVIIARLNAEIVRILQLPELRAQVLEQGYELVGSTPKRLSEQIELEIPKWAKVIREIGLQPE